MLIREAVQDDIDQIIELCSLHAEYEKTDYNPTGKGERIARKLFGADQDLKCLIVEEQGKLLGYATYIRQYSTWDADYYLYLDCIFLREEVRGAGLGSQLMNAVKTYADQNDCFQVQWQTPKFNERAIKFYKKLGASSKDKERFFWA